MIIKLILRLIEIINKNLLLLKKIMNSPYNFKKNKKIKSLDANRTLQIKKLLKKKKNINKSVIYNHSYQSISKESDEISYLSNANLNIIKILNSCAKDDILNDSSFLEINNNNDNIKEKSNIISKRKNNIKKINKSSSLITKRTHRKSKSSKNAFFYKSNNTNISKTILSDGKMDDSSNKLQTSNFYLSNKKFSVVELSNIDKSKIKKGRHQSQINLKTFKLKDNKSPKEKEINNKHRARSKSIIFNENEFINKNKSNTIKRHNKYIPSIVDIEGIGKSKDLLNEIEIMHINENIHNDINFIQLRKKISKLKKSIQRKNSKNDFSHFKSINKKKTTTSEGGGEILENKLIKANTNSDSNNQNNNKNSTIGKLNVSFNSKNNLININDKYRHILRRRELYDSFDDEEYKEEEIDYYISPDSVYIKIFDSLLFCSSMIYFIFVPYYLSKNNFVLKDIQWLKILFILIDIIYIIDFIINFFRAYQNFDEHLIRKNKRIFLHYLKTWFFLDFIQAIPCFSILTLIKNIDNNVANIVFLGYYKISPKIYILLLIKIIKIYKMLSKNPTIAFYSEILERNEILDNHGGFIITFFATILVLNMTTCLFIFIGINSFPSWIVELNLQDKSYPYIYLTSVYFVIVTITTVGYGDITGNTVAELAFQIYLLIIGTIAYSFTISYISNYIVKSNKKSMTFEKNLEILQEIKFHHPNMKNSLYNDVLRNLYNEQLYEKKDKHLLFDCLPYSLKNKLIMEMYRPLIKNFVFFKDIDNSDFIVKVATSLKPLISIKGDIVIQEGDLIKEIIFVKKGVIGLNISIDLNDPVSSLKKYFCQNKIGKLNLSFLKSSIISQQKLKETTFLSEFKRENNLPDLNDNTNIENIKIIEIRNNEHFGDALMFLNEPCPLVAKIRTKKAELLILRKLEAIEIYSIYPNIWKRINKKSLFNMEQIYLKIKKIVIELTNRFNIDINNYLTKRKTNNNLKKSELPQLVKADKNHKENKNEVNDIKNDGTESKKDIEIKHQPKILELDENMNLNINKSLSMNIVENITFIKKSETKKESISSFNSSKNNKLNKKNSLWKNSTILVENKNEDLESNKNKNIKISNKSLKSKKLKENENSSETHINDNSKNNSSVFHNICVTNTTKKINEINSNFSSKIRNKIFNKSYSKYEKILYNSFIHLTTTKEKSFQLSSSYDNINKLSNNKYIKDFNLQAKIKQVLLKECKIENEIKKRTSFLKLPSQLQIPNNISQTPKSSKNNKNYRFTLPREDENFHSYRDNNSDSISLSDINTKKKGKYLGSSNKLIEIKNNDKFLSTRNYADLKVNRTPNLDSRKLKRSPKKKSGINKQLNIISKNIKNTSRNINNPEEFYKNLFNNIIQRESRSFNGDKEENKILHFYSSNRVNEEYISDQELEKNIFSSFNSYKENNCNKDLNLNLIRVKTKNKSGFKIV